MVSLIKDALNLLGKFFDTVNVRRISDYFTSDVSMDRDQLSSEITMRLRLKRCDLTFTLSDMDVTDGQSDGFNNFPL